MLLPDLFYRGGLYDPIDAKTAFVNVESKARIMGLIRATTQDAFAQLQVFMVADSPATHRTALILWPRISRRVCMLAARV